MHRLIFVIATFGFFSSALCVGHDFGQDRRVFLEALKISGVIDEDLSLQHFSHTCNLTIDDATFYVLDVRQVIPGMSAPRGINEIVILSSRLELVRKLRYTRQRPLRCVENRLFVFGSLEIVGGSGKGGSELVFSDGGRVVEIER